MNRLLVDETTGYPNKMGLVMTSLACLLLLMAPTVHEGPDTIVVCPDAFRGALEPWVQYRSRQGHRIEVIPSHPSSAVIRAEIQKICHDNDVQNVILVGDVPPTDLETDDPNAVRLRGDPAELARQAQWCVPTFYVDAVVNVAFGSSPKIATDIGYADIDADRRPDLSIGRMPVDTPEQLTSLIRRIIVYENRFPSDYADRRVNILAEPGGFGAVADTILEMTAKRFIRLGIPAEYEINTTFATTRSPFCPDPRQLEQTTLDRLNEGSLFWVYIGHGQSWYLHPLEHRGEWFSLLDTRVTPFLQCSSRSPIAVFFCCYTGKYDGEFDCLAEEMVNSEGGPIASLAATRVTMPFAMSVLADALLREHFEGGALTLGELVKNAKLQTLQPIEDEDDPRKWMFQLATLFSPTRDALTDEVLENCALYNLLGDPLLRLRRPHEIDIRVAERAQAASYLDVQGELPQSGRLTLELVYRRDRLLADPESRDIERLGDAHWAGWQDQYERANERVCRYVVVDLPAGPFEQTLWVPTYARGACHVRAFLQHGDGVGMGSADVFVKASEPNAHLSHRDSTTDDPR